jgi:hypothetical protein
MLVFWFTQDSLAATRRSRTRTQSTCLLWRLLSRMLLTGRELWGLLLHLLCRSPSVCIPACAAHAGAQWRGRRCARGVARRPSFVCYAIVPGIVARRVGVASLACPACFWCLVLAASSLVGPAAGICTLGMPNSWWAQCRCCPCDCGGRQGWGSDTLALHILWYALCGRDLCCTPASFV